MSPECESLHDCSTNPKRPTFCYAYTVTTIDIMSDTSPWYELRDADGKPYFVNKMTDGISYEVPDTFHPYVNAERDTKPDAMGVDVIQYDPALKISPYRVWVGGAGYKKKYKSKSRNIKRSQKHTRNKKTRSKRRRVKSRRY